MTNKISEPAATYQPETAADQPLNPEPDSAKPAKPVRGRPFVKGQSGNPAGKPRKHDSFVEQLKWERAKAAKQLAKRVVQGGLDPDTNKAIKAVSYMSAYLDGLPGQKFTIMHENNPALELLASLIQQKALPAPGPAGQTIEGDYAELPASPDSSTI